MLSAFAAGSRSRSISRGMIALRVGLFTAKQPDCARRRHTGARPTPGPGRLHDQHERQQPQAEGRDERHVRRSKASANAPPYRPKATSGKSANSPTRPTENVEPVSA